MPAQSNVSMFSFAKAKNNRRWPTPTYLFYLHKCSPTQSLRIKVAYPDLFLFLTLQVDSPFEFGNLLKVAYPDLFLFLTNFKKVNQSIIYVLGKAVQLKAQLTLAGRFLHSNTKRECSSAGEHMTEDHGVGGSTPPIPINPRLRRHIE